MATCEDGQGTANERRMMSLLRTAAQLGVDEIDYFARLVRATTAVAIPPLLS